MPVVPVAPTTVFMFNLLNYPRLLFFVFLLLLWLASNLGGMYGKKSRALAPDEREDFDVVLGATLTLLGLLIGFSFSMAISRYDQRKNYEEEEANAIGTEYARADLLGAQDADTIKKLLVQYLDQRIAFYEEWDPRKVPEIGKATEQTQNQLWLIVKSAGNAQPTPMAALAVSGMNDVINSQGYSQAAWWNRIPSAAWVLMATIAFFACALLGYSAHQKTKVFFLILPLALSVALCLIADIDSPRHGMISVLPHNLISLSESLRAQ